ncbi:protein-L-isoaspartate O-methyltransferase family protein [Salinispira pacifica]
MAKSEKNGARKAAAVAGVAAIVVLVAVGALLAFGGPTPGKPAPTANQAPSTASDRANSAAATTAADATAGNTSKSDTNAATNTAADTADAAAQTADSSTAGSSKTTVSYQSEYSVPVGSSPVNTRARHPVDLYTPKPDPVFDIQSRTQFPPIDNEKDFVQWMLAHTNQKEKFLRERWQRASIAVARHHITHRRILMAFLLTPREWFARSYNLGSVYANTALPIGYGQTISGPDLVARMTDYLDPQPNQKVLEIGTGSGYQSAFLSSLSNYVYTIEIVKPLAEETNKIYVDHTADMPQFGNIHRRMADGYYGWPEYAPFDKIIVTTGTDHIPPDLLKELKPGGVMIIPIGPPTGQTILKITKEVDKDGTVHLTREDIYHGTAKDIFVPFTAAGGGTHFKNSSD